VTVHDFVPGHKAAVGVRPGAIRMAFLASVSSVSRRLACVSVVSALALARDASSEAVPVAWLPGAARVVSASLSGSRDTPLFEYGYGPRPYSTIGAEWGWMKAGGDAVSFRFGMYVFIGLDNHTSDVFFWPYEIWRAQPGLTFTWFLGRLSERLLGEQGDIELGLKVSHESDHGDYRRRSLPDDILYGGGGDFFVPDIALRTRVARTLELSVRLQSRLYAWGAFSACPAADLSLRWKQLSFVNPFVSLFAEKLFARPSESRDGHHLRLLAGAAFPGRFGEFSLFASLDSGNGKGLLINQRDTRVSGAVRYMPFAE
jgi:hypothetical protein